MPFSMLKRGQWRYQLRRGGLPCEFKTFDYKPLPVISGFGEQVIKFLRLTTTHEPWEPDSWLSQAPPSFQRSVGIFQLEQGFPSSRRS